MATYGCMPLPIIWSRGTIPKWHSAKPGVSSTVACPVFARALWRWGRQCLPLGAHRRAGRACARDGMDHTMGISGASSTHWCVAYRAVPFCEQWRKAAEWRQGLADEVVS
jgi:hypothetical protein